MTFEVQVTKKIKADASNAFQAFADGPTWSKWFSDDTKVDLRQGGRFSNADGDAGEYLEIVPDQLLRFTWEGSFAGSQIEIQIEPPVDGETAVSLRHYKLGAQSDADKMKSCWTWTLDNLAQFLETGKPLSMAEWKKLQPN